MGGGEIMSLGDASMFLGKPMIFWVELLQMLDEKDVVQGANVVDLIGEVSVLRSKVSFYEARINQMSLFMKRHLEVTDGKEKK
jgi:hypothetical protein